MKDEKTVAMTHDELMQAQAALQRLGALPLSAQAAYWVGKTFKRVDNQIKGAHKYLNKRHHELVLKCGAEVMAESQIVGEAPKPTGNYNVLPENNDAFQAAWQAELDTGIAFCVLPLSLSALEGNKITAADMAALDWLFEE